MKKWKTTQQMANDIAHMDVSLEDELNIAQCNRVASIVKELYKKGGKYAVINGLYDALPSFSARNTKGFTMGEKDRITMIVKHMFKYHWFFLGRIRRNMRRITK